MQVMKALCWLQVMIAACDTFRSGAVEQLKTHCVRLGVPLYERGYEKDPAKVAFEGQRAAERNKKDVLLVDTAGQALFRTGLPCTDLAVPQCMLAQWARLAQAGLCMCHILKEANVQQLLSFI